jgi:hypothetical protein
MNITRKQLTQISIGLVVIAVIVVLVMFGGSWAVDTFKEMHGL